MGMGRARDHCMHQLRQAYIVGKAALAGEETKVLFPPHRLTNSVRDVARRVHTRYSTYPVGASIVYRAPVGATKVGEDAGLATRYYKRWVFRGRLTDGPKGWNRHPPAARRTGSQVACRPND